MFGGHHKTRQHFILVWLFAAMLGLSACETLMMDTGMARNKARNVAESSYAAADMMIQQSRSFITPETPLEIGVLTDLDNPNERTNFGRLVAEQIASRFVQLGYNVSAQPGIMPPPDMAAPQAMSNNGGGVGSAVITGRYAVARDEVLVNLRIVGADTGKVIAAFDYNVPKTRDVRELVKTQADKDSFFDF